MAKQTFTTGAVLTAAQMTSLQQTAMLGGAASAKTASFTLVAADAGTAISMSNASATTITVNTALFAAGDTVQITNLGAGVCTITAGTATVNTSASLALAQYESGTLDFTSTSAAIFIKGAGAAGGGMVSLASGSIAAAATGVDISSISSDYEDLILYLRNFSLTAGARVLLRFNNNSASNYSFIRMYYDAGANVQGFASVGHIQVCELGGSGTDNFAVIRIYDYADATHYKQADISSSDSSVGPNTTTGITSVTSAVTRVQIVAQSGTFDGGTYELFGVK